jgi:hypothetical protein
LQVAEVIKDDLWPNPLKYFNNVSASLNHCVCLFWLLLDDLWPIIVLHRSLKLELFGVQEQDEDEYGDDVEDDDEDGKGAGGLDDDDDEEEPDEDEDEEEP